MKNIKINEIKCVSCGSLISGNYCYNCGEKKFNKSEHTIKDFFANGFSVFTHFNMKVLKSIFILVTRPGFLTAEQIKGITVKYAKPAQIFFVINVFYFLFNFGFETFTSPLDEYLKHTLYKNQVINLVNEKITENGIPIEKYYEIFYDKIHSLSRLLIFVIIPMLAVLFQVLYRRLDPYFFDNLIFSTHLLSFILLYLATFLNLIYFISIKISHYNFNFDTNPLISDWLSFTIVTVSFCIYLFIALKRIYKQKNSITLIKTIISIAGIYSIIEFYRLFLFLMVFYST